MNTINETPLCACIECGHTWNPSYPTPDQYDCPKCGYDGAEPTNDTHEDIKAHPAYGIAYRKQYKHLRSLCGQTNITMGQLKADIAHMEALTKEPRTIADLADLRGCLDAYTEELERREFADNAPAIEEHTPTPIPTFDDLLNEYTIEPPGTWENEHGPADWWAATNTNGIIAYFGSESNAIAFRSWIVGIETNEESHG